MVNPLKNLALTIPKSTQYNKAEILMNNINEEDLDQIWMV